MAAKGRKFALVLWTKSRKISIIDVNELDRNISKNEMVRLPYGDKSFLAKVMECSGDKKWLKKIVVTEDGQMTVPENIGKNRDYSSESETSVEGNRLKNRDLLEHHETGSECNERKRKDKLVAKNQIVIVPLPERVKADRFLGGKSSKNNRNRKPQNLSDSSEIDEHLVGQNSSQNDRPQDLPQDDCPPAPNKIDNNPNDYPSGTNGSAEDDAEDDAPSPPDRDKFRDTDKTAVVKKKISKLRYDSSDFEANHDSDESRGDDARQKKNKLSKEDVDILTENSTPKSQGDDAVEKNKPKKKVLRITEDVILSTPFELSEARRNANKRRFPISSNIEGKRECKRLATIAESSDEHRSISNPGKPDNKQQSDTVTSSCKGNEVSVETLGPLVAGFVEKMIRDKKITLSSASQSSQFAAQPSTSKVRSPSTNRHSGASTSKFSGASTSSISGVSTSRSSKASTSKSSRKKLSQCDDHSGDDTRGTRRSKGGEVEIHPGSGVFVDHVELSFMNRWRIAPKILTRKLLLYLVGAEKLKGMTARGTLNRKLGLRRDPVPPRILNAVKYYVDRKGVYKLSEAEFIHVINLQCDTLRGRPDKKSKLESKEEAPLTSLADTDERVSNKKHREQK